MVIYNAATRELTAKIVYYGPGLGGKTTNLQLLHERLEPNTVGKLLNLSTQTDRTIYFDLLPVELGDIKGYKIRFQLATVPGQTAFNETRRVVLKGTDGIVFVADSQWSMLPKNLESWQNLKDNLKANGVSFEGIPVVIQYNKRDLTDILSVDALQEALGLSSYPFVEAVASAGRGVTETFKLISKLTFVDLLRRLQGRKPEEAGIAPPRREPDDLLSWKDSLLHRVTSASGPSSTPAAPVPAVPGAPAPPAAESPSAAEISAMRRPLSLVPSLPEEAPFETFDDLDTEASPDSAPAEADSPFTEGPVGSISVPNLPELESGSPEEPLSSLDSPLAHVAETESFQASHTWTPPAAEEQAEAPAPYSDETAPMQSEHSAPMQSRETPPVRSEQTVSMQSEQTIPMPAVALTPGNTPEISERVHEIEQRLEAALAEVTRERDERLRASETASALGSRLEAFERDARSLGKALGEKQQAFAERVQSLENALGKVQPELEGRIRELHERVSAGEKRLRTSEDDVAMALRSVGERGEKVHQQVASLSQQVETLVGQVQSLETALRDKTGQSRREADDIRTELSTLQGMVDEKIGQGRRESEDIRSQIAPLLEAHGQKGAADDRLARDFDRLRESLAESLGELSERIRGAMRGI
ncbi:MAG: ADP-ribosylation factor-like protein [Acidobacteriota bacterium]|nr:ADP-ribosylation factor-like protein [Acidobacteriota bacterium]